MMVYVMRIYPCLTLTAVTALSATVLIQHASLLATGSLSTASKGFHLMDEACK